MRDRLRAGAEKRVSRWCPLVGFGTNWERIEVGVCLRVFVASYTGSTITPQHDFRLSLIAE